MIRQPIVAGQFYPANPATLEGQVRGYLDQAPAVREKPTLLVMAPHAGYVYSGQAAGLALGQANLADTLLLLGPNHTGRGAPFSVWNRGSWNTPLGSMGIAHALADALMAAQPRLTADTQAHGHEHSLEVLLPLLCVARPGCTGVPVAVAEPRLPELSAVAASMAGVLRGWAEPVSLVVSSDMSHYVSHDTARQLDALALDAVIRLDPQGLYATVREHGISMCGVLPMTLGLMIALELGASKAEVVAYATSGEASGDYSRVVGYAGVVVE